MLLNTLSFYIYTTLRPGTFRPALQQLDVSKSYWNEDTWCNKLETDFV